MDRGVGSRYFNTQKILGVDVPVPPLPGSTRPASAIDLQTVPIDDINPSISVTADYGIVLEDRTKNQFTYGVLEKPQDPLSLTWAQSNQGPIGTYVSNLAITKAHWLHLVSPDQTSDNLNTTFTWKFDPGNDVTEVNLFVSTRTEGQGLLPWDKNVALPDTKSSAFKELSPQKQQQLLGTPWIQSSHHNSIDLNPNRILTATWKKNSTGTGGTWFSADGTPISDPNDTSTSFTLPTALTAE